MSRLVFQPCLNCINQTNHTIRIRIQLIKLMLFILTFSSISIPITHIILRIESKNYKNSPQVHSNFFDRNIAAKSCKLVTSDEHSQQYYVVIDGVRYPKLVPSFFNRSIDFNCLNANTPLKTILLWNWDEFR